MSNPFKVNDLAWFLLYDEFSQPHGKRLVQIVEELPVDPKLSEGEYPRYMVLDGGEIHDAFIDELISVQEPSI